jgi:hypothetical protein
VERIDHRCVADETHFCERKIMSRTGNVSVAVRVRPNRGGNSSKSSSSNCITLDRERGKISVRNNDGGMHHFHCDRVGPCHVTQSGVYWFDFMYVVCYVRVGWCEFAETGVTDLKDHVEGRRRNPIRLDEGHLIMAHLRYLTRRSCLHNTDI